MNRVAFYYDLNRGHSKRLAIPLKDLRPEGDLLTWEIGVCIFE
jgi:hypothetical protein